MRGGLVAIVALVICALIVAGVTPVGDDLSSSADSGEAERQTEGTEESGSTESQDDTGETDEEDLNDVTLEDAWILDFFRDVIDIMWAADELSWYEADEGDTYTFFVTDAATDGVIYIECLMSPLDDSLALLDERAVESYGGKLFEEATGESCDYTITIADGTQTSYVFNEYFIAAAIDARDVADAIRTDTAEDADNYFLGVNEYGYTASMMESVSITPEGEAIAKGRLYVCFDAATSKSRIRTIIYALGCTFKRGDKDSSYRYKDAYGNSVDDAALAETVWVGVSTPEGEDEWDVAAAFEEYDEVIEAQMQGPGFDRAASATGTSDAGVSSTQLDVQYYLDASGFTEAWEYATCDGEVTVAVIDSGIDCSNEELSANIDIEHMGRVVDEGVVSADAQDMLDETDEHGTWVACHFSACR